MDAPTCPWPVERGALVDLYCDAAVREPFIAALSTPRSEIPPSVRFFGRRVSRRYAPHLRHRHEPGGARERLCRLPELRRGRIGRARRRPGARLASLDAPARHVLGLRCRRAARRLRRAGGRDGRGDRPRPLLHVCRDRAPSRPRPPDRRSRVLPAPGDGGPDHRRGRPQPLMDEPEWLTERFEQHRPHLRAVAYRMLGSVSETDDALQEAWLRIREADPDDIRNMRAWLTTVVGRVCLNMLRSRRARREESVPDPVVSFEEHGGEHEALLAESVGLALLVVLEALTPAERLAFV